MAFVRAVHNFDKRVRVEPCGFRVPSRAGRVPRMSGASVLPEVVTQLLARCGDAPWFEYRGARVSTMLRDYPEGATVHEHIFKA